MALPQLPPADPMLAALFHALPEAWAEAFSERAGILQYSALMPRPLAETLAMAETLRRLSENLRATVDGKSVK